MEFTPNSLFLYKLEGKVICENGVEIQEAQWRSKMFKDVKELPKNIESLDTLEFNFAMTVLFSVIWFFSLQRLSEEETQWMAGLSGIRDGMSTKDKEPKFYF